MDWAGSALVLNSRREGTKEYPGKTPEILIKILKDWPISSSSKFQPDFSCVPSCLSIVYSWINILGSCRHRVSLQCGSSCESLRWTSKKMIDRRHHIWMVSLPRNRLVKLNLLCAPINDALIYMIHWKLFRNVFGHIKIFSLSFFCPLYLFISWMSTDLQFIDQVE